MIIKNTDEKIKDPAFLGLMLVAVPEGAHDESTTVGNFSVSRVYFLCVCVCVCVFVEILHFRRSLQAKIFEPGHEKTNILHMRKQRRRSASR